MTTKLTPEEAGALEALIEGENERLEGEGFGAAVTVSGFVRSLILQALKRTKGASVQPAVPVSVAAPPAPKAVESEPESLDTANGHSDERTVAEPTHRKRIKPPKVIPPPVDAPTGHAGPVVDQSEGEPEEESGPPGDEDLEALLRDTPL